MCIKYDIYWDRWSRQVCTIARGTVPDVEAHVEDLSEKAGVEVPGLLWSLVEAQCMEY